MKISASVMKPALLSSAALSLLAFAPATFAQDQVEEEAAPADNVIIVTASKREQTLQEVPVAVTVTSAETIERAQIRDLIDLQTVVPSLRVSQLQSSASTTFIIRGFGNGDNNPGIEPSVGVFIDGVYRSRSSGQISDLPNLQRIEVLRGPQSTLFGKNASAGVISIVTQEPAFEFGGSVSATYGNYNTIVVKGDVTGPLSDTIAVSLAGGYNKRDGYVRDLNLNIDNNERDRYFVRGQLLFEPTDNFKIRIIGDYDKIDEVCCGVVNVVDGPTGAIVRALGGQVGSNDPLSYTTFTNVASSNKIENFGGSLQADYDFGGITLTSISAYRENHTLTNQDSDFTSADLIGANVGDIDIETITQEVRLTSDFDGPFNFLAGGFYLNEKVNYLNSLTFGDDFRGFADLSIRAATANQLNVPTLEALFGAPPGTFFAQGQGIFDDFKSTNDAYSFFAQGDFEVTDRLTITAGVAYTKDKKRARSNVVSTDRFSAINLAAAGGQVLTQQAIATTVGQLLGLGRLASAAEVGAFAGANPAGFAQVQAGAVAFGQLNANLTPAQAAADMNPATVGNPFLGLRSLQFLPPFLNFPNSVEAGRTNDDKFTYTVRAAYDITDSVNVYLSYATGYKASSFNLSRDSRPLASDLPALAAAGLTTTNLTSGTRFAGPETAEVFEIGLKAQWDYASINFAAFQQTIEGFQGNTFTGTGFSLTNAGSQRTKGFEFEGSVNPIDALTITAGVTYLDARYKEYFGAPVGNPTGVFVNGVEQLSLTGEKVGGVSPISFSTSATYVAEFANGNELIFRGDYYLASDTPINNGLPTFNDTPGTPVFRREVNLVNGSITFAMQNGLEFSVYGRNILNEKYISTVFDSVAQTGSVSGYPSQPRTYGGTVRYKF